MNKKRLLSLVFIVFFAATTKASAQSISYGGEVDSLRQMKPGIPDSGSLVSAFRKGKFRGNLRYFFMASDNKPGLTDYYANAIGGGIKYETAPYKGFQLAVGGFFIFNIGSSDLTKADPVTKQYNRYEIGLFDIRNPANKNNIAKLEELYLKYGWKQSRVVLGKQMINTPFINLQDGRMRPTEVGGIYGEVNDIKNTKIEGGFIYEVSPRSTVQWFTVAASMGVNPQGLNTEGEKSDYAGNLKSKGIALLGITHNTSKKFTFKLWDVFVQNIFNTAFLQTDFYYPLNADNKLTAGLQYVRQDAMKDGGNPDPSKAYFVKNAKSNIWGFTTGWKNKSWQASLNYTRITKDGRFLMPREWGREPLFTFLPRERNDGFGDLNAYLVEISRRMIKERLQLQAGLGYYDLPDVHNYALNKYSMPSYVQFNLEAVYVYNGLLQGLETRFLYVHKWRTGNTYDNAKYEINKVNFSLWNLVFNFNF